MRLLLDTSALVRWMSGRRFDRAARRRVEQSPTFVSSISMWEVGHKVSLGKLRVDGSLDDAVQRGGFERLAFTFDHAERAAGLPHHHGDPFDRMLIGQAQVERLTVVTSDAVFDAYDVDVIHC